MHSNHNKCLLWFITTLDMCPLKFDELSKKWENCYLNTKGTELARRTFYDHIEDIEDLYNIKIVNDHGKYTIDKSNSTPALSWLMEGFYVTNTMENSKFLQNRIVIDEVPSEKIWLSVVLDAMKTGNKLKVTHRSFKSTNSTIRIMDPFFVKIHKRRWYLFAKDNTTEKILTLALDRIENIEICSETFIYPNSFEPTSYLLNGYGVSIYDDIKPQYIEIKVDAYNANFFRSLPMHITQEEIERNDDYSIFQFFIAPVKEFLYDILRQGKGVEILSPEPVRKQFIEIVNEIMAPYKKTRKRK